MHSSQMDELAATSDMLGYPTKQRQIDGPYPCPTHRVDLRTLQLDAFNGWHEVHLCPQHDGTCSYGPDQDPTHIEIPADVVEAAKAAEAAETGAARARVTQAGSEDSVETLLDLGGGMVVNGTGVTVIEIPPRVDTGA